MFSLKVMGLSFFALLLVAGIVVLAISNASLRGDVDALTDALSRTSPNEGKLQLEVTELKRELREQTEETNRLEVRAEPLERLLLAQGKKITELKAQLKTYEGPTNTTTEVLETVKELESAEVLEALEELETAEVLETVEQTETEEIPASVATLVEGQYVEYVVQSGDILQNIAGRYYGDPNKWRRILDANGETIKDARSLIPGMKLIIPDIAE